VGQHNEIVPRLPSEAGENCIVITPGANALLARRLDANIEILRDAGIVLTQLEIPTETVQHLATICERESLPLMLDPAPAKQLPEGLLDKLSWFTLNKTEAKFFSGDKAARARGDGADFIGQGC
jgi:ribokinase